MVQKTPVDPVLWLPCREGHERCAVDGVECECEQLERDRALADTTDWHPIKSESLRLLVADLLDAGYRIAVIDETNESVLADIGRTRFRFFVGNLND